MNEQAIEDIKNAVRELVRLLADRGQPLSEELKLHLAQVIEYAGDRIQALRNAPIEPTVPDVSSAEIPSSNVEGFGWDDKTGQLLVRFLGKYPDRKGSVYSYSGVPKEIFDLFRKGAVPARTDGKNAWGKWWKGKVPSLGASLYTLIKNGPYQYAKLA